MSARSVSRVIFFVACVAAASALVATLSWEAATIFMRPLDGVEGDVLFEADRIRSKLCIIHRSSDGRI